MKLKCRTTAKRARIETAKSGNVVYTFGNYAPSLNGQRERQQIDIKLAELKDDTQWIEERTKYMTVSAKHDGELVADRIFQIGQEISKKILRDENKPESERILFSHCDVMSHEHVRCLGKIFNSGRVEQLEQKSCIFIGFDENKSRIVQLDFSKLKPSVQVFPGEICIIGGNNPRGKTFYVTEIFFERILENCPAPSIDLLTQPLHLMIASAPFTPSESLSFHFLEKLMVNCQNNKPDVLILTGAFFPMNSHLILDVKESLDEHFYKMLVGISERLGDDTKVIIVSSVNDINSSACYPTRPYKMKNTLNPFPNIFMAPDPSIVDINGVTIGITSIDVTQELANVEFTE